MTGVVNGVTNPTFSYDDNGNLLSGAGRTLSWTSFDKVASLTEAGTTLDFTYDATQQRIKQSDGSNTILYINDPVSGASAEYHTNNGGEWHDYLSADGRRVGIRKEVISPSDINFQFFIQDNQGSVIAVLNEDGTMSQKLSYDAWGLRRNVDGSEDVSNSINPPVSRGYTDHEHLPGSQIINMNGRMYDPELGRHLSADPYTPDPFSSQGYNRYSYVYNNPLRYIDPSGYEPNCPGCPFITTIGSRDTQDPFGGYFLSRAMRALAGSFSYGTEVASIYVDIEALEREIAEGLKNLAKVDDGDEGGSSSLGETSKGDTGQETEHDDQGSGQNGNREGSSSTSDVIREILVLPDAPNSSVGIGTSFSYIGSGGQGWMDSHGNIYPPDPNFNNPEPSLEGVYPELLLPIGSSIKKATSVSKVAATSLGKFLGPKGPVFGNSFYRGRGNSGILNHGTVRMGWSYNSRTNRLNFSLRVGKWHSDKYFNPFSIEAPPN